MPKKNCTYPNKKNHTKYLQKHGAEFVPALLVAAGWLPNLTALGTKTHISSLVSWTKLYQLSPAGTNQWGNRCHSPCFGVDACAQEKPATAHHLQEYPVDCSVTGCTTRMLASSREGGGWRDAWMECDGRGGGVHPGMCTGLSFRGNCLCPATGKKVVLVGESGTIVPTVQGGG